MSFLTEADLEQPIKADMLGALLDGDNSTVAIASDEAEGKMREYLNNIYDIEAIFSAVGDARSKVVLNYCIDICIYTIWKYIDAMQIPKPRRDAYAEAMDWLKMTMDGDISSTLPPKQTDAESGGTILYDSNPKRESHY